MSRICLVSCSSSKRSDKSKAKDLYISPLFQYARRVAERDFDEWFVLSALHGLLEPEKEIAPYDETLHQKDQSARAKWATQILKQLFPKMRAGDEITFLAGDMYREFLINALENAGYVCNTPLRGLGIGQQIHTLKLWATQKPRITHLEQFYSLLDRLHHHQSNVVLATCAGASMMPPRGVYFFFEDGEMKLFNRGASRCVRIGTHAVSKNSSSTLWNRLRTHRGGADFGGNHRGSIFRLHVGAAMIGRGDFSKSPSWGIGQDAAQDIRSKERPLEEAVSKYIGAMRILWLDIRDEPGPHSDRSYIERNSIALLSGPLGPFDLPSRDWLGLHSPHKAIRSSGLWNVNYVDCLYDTRFLDTIAAYTDVTLGIKEAPKRSIAPDNWHSEPDFSQIALL